MNVIKKIKNKNSMLNEMWSKRLLSLFFHLYNRLEKAKQWRRKKDKWLPVAAAGRRGELTIKVQ